MPTYFEEIGYQGLKEFSGYVQEAFAKELYWPSCSPLYSRMRRSDPEISVVRNVFSALARAQSFYWELPDNPSGGDKAAQEFAETVLDDLDGGVSTLLEDMVANVPFMGWGWWEVLPGYRNPAWKPPGGDEWRSQYKDRKVGIRRLAWRDTSSFYKWEFADNGKLKGMWQWAFPKPSVLLPIENSLHLVFGDAHNPEGLSPLEAVWRLERIKYGLEVVQGIGFEHAAGYLDIKVEQTPTPSDLTMIKTAARAIMSAQEGNYAVWPANVTGELKDVPFAAAPAILDAIKYFGILKLTVFNMQWVALSATSGSGSFAAMNDSSSMFVMTYNAMMEGFAHQLDEQLGKRLFKWNEFPGMTKRPTLKIDPVNKLSLTELAAILAPLKNVLPMGDEDMIAIRKQTGFLPDTLPEEETGAEEPEPDALDQQPSEDKDGEGMPGEGDMPDDAESRAGMMQQSLLRYKAWAAKHDPRAFAELETKIK